LHPDHRGRGAMIDQPVDQAPVALRGVRDNQRRDLAAAVINQRDCVVVLVNVDTDDQGGLLSGGWSRGGAGERRFCVDAATLMRVCYQVSFAGPPATRWPTNRAQAMDRK